MFFWDERLHFVCTEVVVGLVHVHQSFVRFPSNLKLKGESAIAVSPTVDDDGLNDELMFVVLSH